MSSKKIVAIAGSVIAAGCYFIVLFLIGGLTGASLIGSVLHWQHLGFALAGLMFIWKNRWSSSTFTFFRGRT